MLVHFFDLGADEDVAFERLQMLQGVAVSHGFEVVGDLKCDIHDSNGEFIDHTEIFEIATAEQNNGVPSWAVLSWVGTDFDAHAQYVQHNTFRTVEEAETYLEKWKVQLNAKLASMDIVTFQNGVLTAPDITITRTTLL